jgi:hypothetical protein
MMSRRSVFVALAIVCLLTCSTGTALLLLLHYEPHHHRSSATPPGDRRIHCSLEFTKKFFDLISEMHLTAPWSQSFTDEQINSYLNEGFIQSGMSRQLLPVGISEPRVLFEADRMRLSFRYRSKLVSTVISVKLRVWLPEGEANVVAVSLERFQAGLVPYSAHWLLERISEAARQNGIEVSWYRYEGSPVALVRFQADQPRPTLQLRAVRFKSGSISIHGGPPDHRSQTVAPQRWLALHGGPGR